MLIRDLCQAWYMHSFRRFYTPKTFFFLFDFFILNISHEKLTFYFHMKNSVTSNNILKCRYTWNVMMMILDICSCHSRKRKNKQFHINKNSRGVLMLEGKNHLENMLKNQRWKIWKLCWFLSFFWQFVHNHDVFPHKFTLETISNMHK